jgi:hypothetical protein
MTIISREAQYRRSLTPLKTTKPGNLWTDQLINECYKASRSIGIRGVQTAKSSGIKLARSSEEINKKKELTTLKLSPQSLN